MPEMLEVTGGRLHYAEYGEGPEAIVFVHGGGGNHLSWWNQIPHFSDRFRCVTYDVRGFGRSEDHSGEGNAAHPRDLGELMDQLEIKRAALAGQSLGGFSVLPYAVRNPDRVAALLLSGTIIGFGDAGLVAEFQKQAANAPAVLQQNRMVGPAYRERSPEGVFLYNQIRALNPPLDRAVRGSFGVEGGAASNEELGNLTMPVVLLSGSVDELVPPAIVQRAATLIPHARYVEVPDGGHSVYWELPAAYNAVLEELLAEAHS